MSSIHKALKKAQKERDYQHREYEGVLTAQGGRRFFSSKPVLFGSLVALVVLSAVIFYIWFNPRGIKTAEGEKNTNQKDVSALITQKQVSPSFQKKPAMTRERKQPDSKAVPAKGSISKAEDIEPIYDKARAFQKIGRLNDAKRLYQKVPDTNPDYVDALNNLGVIMMHEKDYKAARANFEKAIRLQPENVDPQYNLACVYALKGETGLGILHLKKACLLNQAAGDWARRDTDLAKLRKMPEFENIIRKDSGIRNQNKQN